MATKKRCKHGRNPKTGRCRKTAVKRKSRGGSAGDKWSRMEAEWDKKSPGWRDYGEEGPSRSRPFGRVSSSRRRSRR